MIPILELEGYFAILMAIIIVTTRLYVCSKIHDHQFIMETIAVAIITSIIWLLFGIYKSNKSLTNQFIIVIMIYSIFLFTVWCGVIKTKNKAF